MEAQLNRMVLVSVAYSLLLALFPVTSPAQNKAATASQPAKAAVDPLKGLSRSHDQMRGITWYRSPSSPKHTNANGFYLYFGKENSGQFLPLRLVVQYYADDWLFISRAWAKADGAKLDVPQKSQNHFGWERDNSGGMIWEWSDTAVTSTQEIATVRRISEAKSVTVRFEGRQYYNDKTLSANQLKAMREVILAYEAATGKPWK